MGMKGRVGAVLFAVCTAVGHAQGPDIIVSDIYETRSWGTRNGISAFSFGTVSCNIGDREVNWYQFSRFHPVISQNVFRFKDGRFEHIGQSWLKHGFCALALNLCFNDCQDPRTCDLLGVHCADPYNSLLNGNQQRLGPKSEVNATTGYFEFPIDPYEGSNLLDRRLQIHNADLNPDLNAGAIYFVEAHYITSDEVPFRTDMNNASYRRIALNGLDPNYSFSFVDGHPTRREKPAILAWIELDPVVRIETVRADGRFMVGSRATPNQDGTWRYNYAVYNMNSHQSARAFEIALPEGTQTGGLGFHDVDYHSGEGEAGGIYDGTDWTANVGDGFIRWETDPYEVNVNANAIRWATLYNFWFDSNLPPGAGTAMLTLFRPGTPDAIPVDIVAPVATSSVTCEMIQRFTATCNARQGKLIIKIVGNSKKLNGYAVGIAVDAQPEYVVLSGKKAKLSKTVSAGNHTVALLDPADCREPLVIPCP